MASGCPVAGGGGQLGGSSAIVTINDSGVIQSVDRGCCEMFGYEMHDLPGQPLKVLIPTPYKEQHDSYLAEYHRTGNAKIIGKKRTVEGLHRSGAVFPLRLAVSEVNTGRGRIYIGMLEAVQQHVADLVCDARGRVRACSGGVADIWGLQPREVLGEPLEKLLPRAGGYAPEFAAFLASGASSLVGCVRNARALLANGSWATACLRITHERARPPRLSCPAPAAPAQASAAPEAAAAAAAATETATATETTTEAEAEAGTETEAERATAAEGGAGEEDLFRARVERVDLDREAVFTLRQDGCVLSANSAFLLPLMGYTGAELEGRPIAVVLPDLEGTLLPRRLKRRKPARAPAKQRALGGGNGYPAQLLQEEEEEQEGGGGEAAPRSLWLEGSLGDSSAGLPTARTKCLHKDGSSFLVEVRIARFLQEDAECFSLMVRRASTAADDDVRAAAEERTPVGLDFVMGARRIGAGSFGKVRQGWRVSTNEPVAIKVIEKALIDAAELQRARREISIMRSLEHRSICRLFDVVETKESLYIVMELCANGELFQFVTARGRLEEQDARAMFRQIVEAVAYCHSKSIIHRDIKHKNILLDATNRIKLIDFGLSNYSNQDGLRSTFCGTPAYSAPEMILAQKYVGPEVDVWSVGVVLYSMLTGEFPFKTVSHIIEGSYTMPDNVSEECQDVLRKMLVVDGKARASAAQLLEHSFVTGAPALPEE